MFGSHLFRGAIAYKANNYSKEWPILNNSNMTVPIQTRKYSHLKKDRVEQLETVERYAASLPEILDSECERWLFLP